MNKREEALQGLSEYVEEEGRLSWILTSIENAGRIVEMKKRVDVVEKYVAYLKNMIEKESHEYLGMSSDEAEDALKRYKGEMEKLKKKT